MSILNPYTWLIGILVLALTGGSGFLYGMNHGKKIERAEWQTKELKADHDVQDNLAAAQTDVETREASHQKDLANISAHYQKELQNVYDTKDRVIHDLRAGALRLRDPGTVNPAGAGAMPSSVASSSGCDGQAGSHLSEQISEFLASEASRADGIVEQLNACQAVVVKDREICGGGQ